MGVLKKWREMSWFRRVLVALLAGMILGGRGILGLFIDQRNVNAANVLEIAYHYLFVMSCLLSSLYLLYVFRNTLQSMGNATASLWSGIGELFARVFAACVLTSMAGREALVYAEPTRGHTRPVVRSFYQTG